METNPNGPTKTGIFSLHLDLRPAGKWLSEAEEFDYLIVSAGHWFYRPLVFYENKKIALGMAFKAINALKNYKGRIRGPLRLLTLKVGFGTRVANAADERNQGATRPVLDENLELYMIQVEEFRKAEEEARERGLKYRLLDTTQAMLLRPDGHPKGVRVIAARERDCITMRHRVLAGPIDTWGDFLLEMLKTEGRRSREEKLRHNGRKLKA
ncbi:hypothetical protein NL676_039710 [Syzygium grande]|nr:hypothetical protein NL676_039710 [Syzygium grande]